MKKKYPEWCEDVVFTNAEGFDWIPEKSLTEKCEDGGLSGYKVYSVGKNGTLITIVIINKEGTDIYANPGLEDTSVHIDILILANK